MGEDITFKRRGDIKRGKIRVGWIRRLDEKPGGWSLSFTPASGIAIPVQYFNKLSDAKYVALNHLRPTPPAEKESKL